MKNLFVTGDIGVGKSTAIKKIINANFQDKRVYGFFTKKINVQGIDNVRSKIYIYPAMSECIKDDDHCVAEITRVGKPVIHKNVFEDLGVKLISNIPKGSLVVMDELGFLENGCHKFCTRIMEIIEDNYIVIGVIKNKHTDFLDSIRNNEKTLVYHIDKDTRDEVVYKMMNEYKEYIRFRKNKFKWDEDRIRWYKIASMCISNNRDDILSHEIINEFNMKNPYLCDYGCGLGYLDIKLALSGAHVKCIEVDEDAVTHMRKTVNSMGIKNIDIEKSNLFDYNQEKNLFDGAICCLVNISKDKLYDIIKNTKYKVICITRKSTRRGFSVTDEYHHSNYGNRIREYLKEIGVSYYEKHVSCSFGQPFNDKRDFEKFMLSYNNIIDREELDRIFKFEVKKNLNSEYPFFLPNIRSYNIFVIDSQHIE